MRSKHRVFQAPVALFLAAVATAHLFAGAAEKPRDEKYLAAVRQFADNVIARLDGSHGQRGVSLAWRHN